MSHGAHSLASIIGEETHADRAIQKMPKPEARIPRIRNFSLEAHDHTSLWIQHATISSSQRKLQFLIFRLNPLLFNKL